ncbi:hypothetical protein [Absidia glauca]|uniref:Calpain catalytic domain-containing protein n=1 Tax=Absidia glauca TaxID=4829 RepID=A0A163K1H5_ABSGL|nr:hypothetical protein [Absidia glauca]
MTEDEAAKMGLVPTHAYAVIDIKTVMGVRFMQVKNPWSHKRWCGPYSHLDTTHWTSELMDALNFDPSVAEQIDDGIFWIDFDSVCGYFTSIHLNWNPELFTHRWVLHSVWPENVGPKRDIYNLGYNPQFSLTVTVPDKKPAAVWLLLSKHIMVTEENTDYITLHVYNDTNGERIYYPGEPFKEGTYVNSPHILVRFNAPPGTSSYTIVVSQHEKEKSLYFSLRAYSLAPFKLREVPLRYLIEQKINGQWGDLTAGGNASNASYMHNPQWRITIPPGNATSERTGLLLMLEASKSFAIHLLLVEGGKRATSAMGCPSYGSYGKNPRHLLEVRELTTLRVRLQADKIDPVPSINVTIYERHPTELFGQEIATSGPYTNVIQGVTTGEVVLSQNETGKNRTWQKRTPLTDTIPPSPPLSTYLLIDLSLGYIIVFATHDKDIGGEFSAIIYSDRPVNIRNDR